MCTDNFLRREENLKPSRVKLKAERKKVVFILTTIGLFLSDGFCGYDILRIFVERICEKSKDFSVFQDYPEGKLKD